MDLVVRATLGFFLILLITRVVGRRELSSMGPFDLILLVVIGDLVQQGITQSDDSFTGLALVLTTVALLTVGVSYLSFRFRVLERVLEGEPIVLVERGRLIERNLRRQRITRGDLAAAARGQGIDKLADIFWAVLESDGRVTFIERKDRGPG